MTEDPWLTVDQVAERIGKSRKTLLNWHHLGRGPKWAKFGKTLHCRLSWLVQWENDQAPKGA